MPAKPFTCRSTKPGIATPRLPPSRPTATTTPSSTSTSPGSSRPSTRHACTPSLIARAPSARRRRRRRAVACASAASMPASSETIATFASPPEAASASSTWSGVGAARLRDDAVDARSELVVRRDDVDHEVAVGLPEADHRDRRDHVEDELLRRARLEPRRACDHLGPDDDRDLVIGRAGRAPTPARRRARS